MRELKESASLYQYLESKKFLILACNKYKTIFGSYARNDQTDKSDLILLIEFNDQIGIRFIDLTDEVEKIVGFNVDLVSKNGIIESYFKAINSDLIYV